MHIQQLKTVVSVLACGLLVAACQSLDIPDANAPTLAGSLGNANNIEVTVGTATKCIIANQVGDACRFGSYIPSMGTSALAEESTHGSDYPSFTNGYAFQQVANEPRSVFNNSTTGNYWNRGDHSDLYMGGVMCNYVLDAIKTQGIKIGTVSVATPLGSHTQRDQWWCTFVIGWTNAEVGTHYDHSTIIPDSIKADPFDTVESTYSQLVTAGVGSIHKAIGMALNSYADSLPTTWINLVPLTNTQAVKVMYTVLAKAPVDAARNTEENAAINWDQVGTYLDSGILSTWDGQTYPYHTAANSVLGANGMSGDSSNYTSPGLVTGQQIAFGWTASASTISATEAYYAVQLSQTGTTTPRVNIRFLGPWDTTGAYQWWLTAQGEMGSTLNPQYAAHDTVVGSPDHRVNGFSVACANTATTCTGSAVKGATGSFFGRKNCIPTTSSNTGTGAAIVLPSGGNAVNGAWSLSNYVQVRFQCGTSPSNTGVNPNRVYYAHDGYVRGIDAAEVNLLRAEAYLRQASPNFPAAAALVNLTRTIDGKLPPVDNTGTMDQSAASCVPRNEDGSCTNLMMAMFYEKRIEESGVNAMAIWGDWRRFGKLLPGSMISMPVANREASVLLLPYYTYGGLNEPGDVPPASAYPAAPAGFLGGIGTGGNAYYIGNNVPVTGLSTNCLAPPAMVGCTKIYP